MAAARQRKIADKDEILRFLTGIMRDDTLGEKDRIGAAVKLGSYLGLDACDRGSSELPQVIIYDGTEKDSIP